MPILEVGVNSYVTLAEATAYLEARLYASAWDAAAPADQEKALVMAARAIDRQRLQGSPVESAQALQFPRAIGRVEQETVPDVVQHAQVEEALALLERGNSKRRKLQADGVNSFSLGKLSESYSGRPSALLSVEARELLAPYLARTVSIQ